MSFNNNHITPLYLTRDNYEEAFLMYVDEELTPEQKAEVEAFAAQHPDLQEELTDLLSTRLPLPEVTFMDKGALMADSMKECGIDGDLLLYIDNELPFAQAQAVEQKIKEDKAYSLQHQLLAQTKLDATEKIVYPYKAELYRHTERKVVIAPWWRAAAAAVVLLCAGTFYWSSTNDNTVASGPVALQTQPKQALPNTTDTDNNLATTKNVTEAPSVSVQQAPVLAVAQKEKQRFTNNQAATTEAAVEYVVTETAVASILPAAQRITDIKTSADFIPEGRQQIFNDAVVTSAAPVRTISTEAHTTTPVPVEGDVASAGSRGGSLKGFLRKTTRFIERTTSINPLNADDELLIGALAIKVK